MEIRGGLEAIILGHPSQGTSDDLDTLIIDFIDQVKNYLELTVLELPLKATVPTIITAPLFMMLTKSVIPQACLKHTSPKTYKRPQMKELAVSNVSTKIHYVPDHNPDKAYMNQMRKTR
ncbi:MAG: hypothetical protein LC541_07995 [Candidatus Thiodiazotropha sp.]|nr:hypothetical protein [Candidatus Thiodiazotropha sp.]MCM8883222.1 hypothetical protein [Candidatus Thiodiazotropha sp.]MCM8920618.1 hypothetical protein [Candidatus Thiodiazotropha sp.]